MKSTNHVTHCFERALRKTVFKQVYICTTLIRKYSKYYPHRLIQYILPSYVKYATYTPSYVNTINTVVNTRTVYTTLIMAPFIKALRVVYCTRFCHTIKWAAILLLRFFCCDYLSGYQFFLEGVVMKNLLRTSIICKISFVPEVQRTAYCKYYSQYANDSSRLKRRPEETFGLSSRSHDAVSAVRSF